MNGVCTFGGNGYSCQTARTVYKITCKANGCDCFYIGKSQQYVKKQVQEHIGEVAKIYAKAILPTNQQPARRMSSQPQTSTTSSIKLSLNTMDSVHKSQPLCIIINDNASNLTREASTRAIRRTNSNDSSITNDHENEPPRNLMPNPPPIINFCPIEAPPDPPDLRQENCSALACQLLSLIH